MPTGMLWHVIINFKAIFAHRFKNNTCLHWTKTDKFLLFGHTNMPAIMLRHFMITINASFAY